MTRGTIGIALMSAAALLMAAPAEADVLYNWTVSLPLMTGGAIIGSGQLTAASTISTSYDGLYTGFLVSSITGTYGGSTITGLAAVNTAHGNDNLIETSQNLLDWDGISFSISPAITGETNPVNLFNRPGFGYTDLDTSTAYGTFTLTAVPEP